VFSASDENPWHQWPDRVDAEEAKKALEPAAWHNNAALNSSVNCPKDGSSSLVADFCQEAVLGSF